MYQDDSNPPDFHNQDRPPPIPVQAFTAILGTLLLSPSTTAGGAARYTVVQILERIRRLDSTQSTGLGHANEDDPLDELEVGLFGKEERFLFQQEILYQVVIGMGRLDAEPESDEFSDDDSQAYDDALEDRELESSSSTSTRQASTTSGQSSTNALATHKDHPAMSLSPSLMNGSSTSSNSTPDSTTESTPSDSSDDGFFSSGDSSNSSLSAAQTDSDETVSVVIASASPSQSPRTSRLHIRVESPKDSYGPTSTDYSRTQSDYFGGNDEEPPINDAAALESDFVDHDEADQAAVGRLSSMSLMAAVAVSGKQD